MQTLPTEDDGSLLEEDRQLLEEGQQVPYLGELPPDRVVVAGKATGWAGCSILCMVDVLVITVAVVCGGVAVVTT